MQIEALASFLAVARDGGFHPAARSQHLTQAAISARVRQLEERLNLVLFERTRKGAVLTEAGRRLLPYAEQIVRTWEYVSDALGEELAEHAALRLGAQLSIWELLLVDWMAWLEVEFGQMPVTLDFDYHSDMLEAVRHRLLDVAITQTFQRDRRLCFEPLGDEVFLLLADRSCDLSDSDRPAMVDFDWGAEFRLRLQALNLRLPRRRLFLGNSRMGLRYILGRGGMGWYPKRRVREQLERGQLQVVGGSSPIAMPVYAAYRADHPDVELIRRSLEGLHELRAEP